MNPFDAVGTARISSAVYDRTCRLLVDYQSAERGGGDRRAGRRRPRRPVCGRRRRGRGKIVELVRRTRTPSRGPHRLVGAGSHRRHRRRGQPRRAARPAGVQPQRGAGRRPDRPVRPGPAARGRRRGRPRRSSPSCGRRCSAAAPTGKAREKLAPRLGPPAPAREGGCGGRRGGGRSRPGAPPPAGSWRRHEHFERGLARGRPARRGGLPAPHGG